MNRGGGQAGRAYRRDEPAPRGLVPEEPLSIHLYDRPSDAGLHHGARPETLEKRGIPLKIADYAGRVAMKVGQIASFFRHAHTPYSLAIDSVRLKRTAFEAVSEDGLKLKLKPRSGESFTFYENLIRKDYLRGGIALRPGDTVVDVGANIGSFSVLAASIVGPGGRVISFEPVGETFGRLEENIALNGLCNVQRRRAAVDVECGVLELHTGVKSAFATAHLKDIPGNDRTVEVVECLTLARVFEEYRIDRINLLKLDCEGSEHGIIESLTPDLAARIDQIAMEVHPVEGRSAQALGEALRGLGFDYEAGSIWFARNRNRPQVAGTPS